MAAADFRRPLTGLCAVRRSQDVRPVRAGAFGPGRPSPAPGSLTIICEVIEGAGPHQPPGNRSGDGKAERPDSNRLNGDPRDLIRAMPVKGDHPAGRFWPGGHRHARLP